MDLSLTYKLLLYMMKKKVSNCSLNPSYVFCHGKCPSTEQDATSAREVTTDASSLSKLQVDFQGPLDQVRFYHITFFILYDAH